MSGTVKIHRADGVWKVLVNGEDMADQILGDSFSVTDFNIDGTARVHTTLAADVEIDIPDAEMVDPA